MNIEARKISLIQQLLLIQQETVLDKIEALLSVDTFTLSDGQKKAIDKGLESLNEGKKMQHEQVMDQIKERFPKYFK